MALFAISKLKLLERCPWAVQMYQTYTDKSILIIVWPQTCLDAQDTSKCLNNK